MNDELKDTIKDIAVTQVDDAVPATWLDANPEQVSTMLANRGQNRAALMSWVSANLHDGTDYGVIKNKKSLWKPGAEKIAGMLGLQVAWPDLSTELDRLREGASTVFLECHLMRDNHTVAQGAGARSVEQDGGDWNKAIKMAKKSAMIDAVLNVGGLSEVFTQDLEDMERDKSTLSEESQNILADVAEKYFADQAPEVLQSLARRRFHIGDGDYAKIPSYRLADAIRSLEEKGKTE